MMEYWIVPGKLPVLIGEVGGEVSIDLPSPRPNPIDDARFRPHERR